jgi:DnaK suppressor protein
MPFVRCEVDARTLPRLRYSFDFMGDLVLWTRLLPGEGHPTQAEVTNEEDKKKNMDKKKIETFKKKLEVRRNELRTMVVRNQQDGRTADDEATQDVADRAASSYNKEFLFSQSNNDRQLLNMVDGALARIREGSFGECVSCGKEINAKRLDAVPWTRHCIECQEKAEQGLLETAQ